MNIDELIGKIQDALSPDLLKPEYRELNKNNPMFGHCYVATEAMYHLVKDEFPGRFSIFRCKDDEGIVHWWLHDNEEIKIIDITADQYYSIEKLPPYMNGKRGAFLTKYPSKRAKTLIERIGNETPLY